MKLATVESSMIHAVGDERKSRTLEVIFNSDRTYCYENVPTSEYRGPMEAPSKGQYMRYRIIDTYPCYQLRGSKRL